MRQTPFRDLTLILMPLLYQTMGFIACSLLRGLCLVPGAPLGHLTLCVVPWSNGAMAAGDAVALAASLTAAASVLAPM